MRMRGLPLLERLRRRGGIQGAPRQVLVAGPDEAMSGGLQTVSAVEGGQFWMSLADAGSGGSQEGLTALGTLA